MTGVDETGPVGDALAALWSRTEGRQRRDLAAKKATGEVLKGIQRERVPERIQSAWVSNQQTGIKSGAGDGI